MAQLAVVMHLSSAMLMQLCAAQLPLAHSLDFQSKYCLLQSNYMQHLAGPSFQINLSIALFEST